MPASYQTHIGMFTRKSTFLWAAVGATVGLSNLWQFPSLARLHGGGLFVLLYLCSLFLVTLPLMVTETVVGAWARQGVVRALDGLVRRSGAAKAWMIAGRLSTVAAFLVLSFTAVFGAIALAYVFYGALGRFSGASQAQAVGTLARLVSDPDKISAFMGWHGFFLLLVLWVSARGVARGLERAFRLIVPGTLVLFLALLAFALWHGRVSVAFDQVLGLHPENLTWNSLRAALFQAFFTLGLGMGVWTILGAYAAPGTPLKRSAVLVVLLDALVAVLAGLVLFSVAAQSSLPAAERGFSLLFVSLPVTLAGLPASQFVIASVFLLVVMVVWSTALALLEPLVSRISECTGASRGLAVAVAGVAVWLAGLATLFSFNLWAHYQPGGATVFRWVELLAGGVVIPLVAMLVALFVGWCLTRHLSQLMLGEFSGSLFIVWRWVMRIALPLVLVYISVYYTAVSLTSLCDDAGAPWCRASPVSDQEKPQSPSESTREDDNILYHGV